MSTNTQRLLGAAAFAALLAAAPAAAEFQFASAGGNPAAATVQSKNQPTKSWQPWQPKPSYPVSQLPDQYMGASRAGPGSDSQSGFNQCLDGQWSQQSKCQTAWLNSLDDFCVWGPPEPGPVGHMERLAVAYCTKPHGTRMIPDGTIKGAHWVKTKDYVQITGVGDFTSIGVPVNDDGGEMDSAGADDLSNPIGGVVYTTAARKDGQPVMVPHWTNFMSQTQFCFRACFGDDASAHCQHIYDVLGCDWNIPANYQEGVFESCEGANAPFQGVYDMGNGQSSTFSQGQPVTPSAHAAPSSSNCKAQSTVANGLLTAMPIGAIATSAPSNTTSNAAGSATSAASGMATSAIAAASSKASNVANAAAQQTTSRASGSPSGAAPSINFNGAALAAGAVALLAGAAHVL